MALAVAGPVNAAKHWVATWATAEQVVEPHNCPPPPGLQDNSIRQIVQTSISGKTVRVKFSNEFSRGPVTINAAEIAIAATAGSSCEIKPGTEVNLTFSGSRSVTIQPGELVTSDEVTFPMGERENVAITMHLGEASSTSVTNGNTAAANWNEQGVNTLGQILLLAGVATLHKAGAREASFS